MIGSHITFLYAENPVPCWTFYEEALGLELARDQGRVRIYAMPGGGYLGICQARAPRLAPMERQEGSVMLTLVVDDVAAWRARLAEHGPSPVMLSEAFRIEHFFLQDPAGHVVEVQRFLEPLPQQP